jgi:hypothetical protein
VSRVFKDLDVRLSGPERRSMTTRVSISDAHRYPYAIVSKRLGTPEQEGFELHFIESGVKADWWVHTEKLRASGEFDWVRFTTMNFMDEATGAARYG